jgi:hypothetical protein
VLLAVVNCFRVYCDFHIFLVLCCVVLYCGVCPALCPLCDERATGEVISLETRDDDAAVKLDQRAVILDIGSD